MSLVRPACVSVCWHFLPLTSNNVCLEHWLRLGAQAGLCLAAVLISVTVVAKPVVGKYPLPRDEAGPA